VGVPRWAGAGVFSAQDGGNLTRIGALRGEERWRETNATFVVERLATLLPHHAALVGRVAECLIARWRTELGDARTATAIAAPQLIDLAITLHRLGPEGDGRADQAERFHSRS
jgi:hypothetical protein